MAFENIDGSDFRRYIYRVETVDRQHLQRSSHENITSIDPRTRTPGKPETSTPLETRFENLELSTKPTAVIDNAVAQSPNGIEHSLGYRGGRQPIETGTLAGTAAGVLERKTPIASTFETQDAQTEGISSDEYDISDDDTEDELKIAFHQAEIIKHCAAGAKMTSMLEIHLRALSETYQVISDLKFDLLKAALYVTGDKPDLHQCSDILASFKANRSIPPEDAMAAITPQQQKIVEGYSLYRGEILEPRRWRNLQITQTSSPRDRREIWEI
ncbi:hypothetical protein AA313_de0205928 [Arthrobotrys entomopaga]|nr:hypothetical protein AA313_de0205928 [Arthrobotrys entomopaga]